MIHLLAAFETNGIGLFEGSLRAAHAIISVIFYNDVTVAGTPYLEELSESCAL